MPFLFFNHPWLILLERDLQNDPFPSIPAWVEGVQAHLFAGLQDRSTQSNQKKAIQKRKVCSMVFFFPPGLFSLVNASQGWRLEILLRVSRNFENDHFSRFVKKMQNILAPKSRPFTFQFWYFKIPMHHNFFKPCNCCGRYDMLSFPCPLPSRDPVP